MALSDEEQRRLDELERSLKADDKAHRVGLAGRLGSVLAAAGAVDDARQRRRVAACAVMGVGLVVLLTGLMLTQGSAVFGALVAVVGLVWGCPL
jgi:hypothetical protein